MYGICLPPRICKETKSLFRKISVNKKDFEALLTLLQQSPRTGTALGKDCYKIRLAIKSKGKGKSGGARIITCVRILSDTIYFLTIYDKSEQENITDGDLAIFVEYVNRGASQ